MTTNQTEAFVPLTAATPKPGERQEYSVSVVTEPERAQSFKPLMEPAGHSPQSTVHAGGRLRTADCGLTTPRVSIQREGDHVTGIRVHCGCGQVIDLACVYQEAK